ncbi:MAG: hypothetical protein QM757_40385 [Paludibaculum sp.]
MDTPMVKPSTVDAAEENGRVAAKNAEADNEVLPGGFHRLCPRLHRPKLPGLTDDTKRGDVQANSGG